MWDNSVTDRDIFVAYDQSEGYIYTFLVKPDDVEEGGTSCICLGKTKVNRYDNSSIILDWLRVEIFHLQNIRF